MKKILLRYLKPFWISCLLAVVLLFAQALCELNLPNYLSDMVTGIQQSGIEHAAPDAISAEGFSFIAEFLPQKERAFFADSYRSVSADALNGEGRRYGDIYPNGGDTLLVIGDMDEEARARLDKTFGTALWTCINTLRAAAQAQPQSQSANNVDGQSFTDMEDIDLPALYGMVQMLRGGTALGQSFYVADLPAMAPMVEAAREAALKNDDMILNQSGILLAKAFYKELGADLGAMQNAYIFRIGFLMLLIAFAGGAATVLVSFFSSRISAGVARDLRRDTFTKIESFSNHEFDKFSTASLITRCTNDVTQIQMLLTMGIRMLCYAPIMGIGGINMAVRKSSSMSWIIALACILLLGLIGVIVSIAMPKFKLIQKQVDKLNLVARENLSGLMVIRAFSTQTHEANRFKYANDELTNTSLFVTRVMVFMMPMMMLLMNGVSLLIVWTGAHHIAQSTMQVGDMMAFMQYAMQIIMSFLMISMMFIFIPRATVSAERICEILDTEVSIKDPKNPKAFDERKRGVVEFKNVSFRYHGAEEDAVSHISFTALPGQTTAIIGPTGAGKSTIVNLLLRFYDTTDGTVYLDGVDLRDALQKDIRAKIGYVPQKGTLFSGTIESNLRYGKPDAADEELARAASIAQAAGFIGENPDGYEGEITQGGVNVSGGQRQRLSIARALVKQPEVFIFDDSFSALDFKTDAALRRALREKTGDSTVIIVAQRVSSILSAEQIIVLEEGRIVGRGRHEELLKSCPAYYEIAASQLSKEELQ